MEFFCKICVRFWSTFLSNFGQNVCQILFKILVRIFVKFWSKICGKFGHTFCQIFCQNFGSVTKMWRKHFRWSKFYFRLMSNYTFIDYTFFSKVSFPQKWKKSQKNIKKYRKNENDPFTVSTTKNMSNPLL